MCRLRIADCELQIANCRLRIADCELQIANCRLRIACCACRLLPAACRLPPAACREERSMSVSSVLSYLVRRLWMILAVAGVVILLDQWTKELVRQSIPKHDYTVPIPALGHYLVFEHVGNYGAAFGILQGHGEIFIVVAAIVSLVIMIYAVRSLAPDQNLVRFLLGLQMGGAIGNVIDRIQQGYVTDFIKVGIPGVYYWPNFNIADSAIVGGVIGLAAVLIWQDIRDSRKKPDDENDVRTHTVQGMN
jgi:signal peptidase II